MKLIIDISEGIYKHVDTIQNGSIGAKQIINSVKNGVPAYKIISSAEPKTDVLDKIRAEIEQLPTKTRTNWNGCCPDIDYPQIEYIDVTKNKLLSIIDKYTAESEDDKK